MGKPLWKWTSYGRQRRTTASARYRLVALNVALLVSLTACSGSEDVTGPQTSATRQSAGSAVGEDPLSIDLPGPTPLHAYFLSPTERATIQQAQDVLIAKCLQRFGFDRAVPDFSDRLKAAQQSEDEADSRLYGVTDAAAARKYGLGVDLSADSNSGAASEPSSSGAFTLVLTGSEDGAALMNEKPASPGEVDGIRVPAGGCLGDARRTVTGSVRGTAEELGRDLWIQANYRAQSDPAYLQVTDEWKTCMKRAGYSVTAVLDDKGDSQRFARDLATTKPSPEEIAFALKTIECKKDVDLVPRLHELDSSYSKEAIDTNQLALDEDRARLDAAIKKATRVVGDKAS